MVILHLVRWICGTHYLAAQRNVSFCELVSRSFLGTAVLRLFLLLLSFGLSILCASLWLYPFWLVIIGLRSALKFYLFCLLIRHRALSSIITVLVCLIALIAGFISEGTADVMFDSFIPELDKALEFRLLRTRARNWFERHRSFWSANNITDVLLNLIDGIIAHLDY